MSCTTKEIALEKSLKHWQGNEKKLREAKQVTYSDYSAKTIFLEPRGKIFYGSAHCSACGYDEIYGGCPILDNEPCGGDCFGEWNLFNIAVGKEGPTAVLADLAAAVVARIEAAIARRNK